MICPNCRKDIAIGSRFCYNCGAKQPEAAAPSAPPAYNSRKRLVRSINDRKIAGVCAGVADYFDLDPLALHTVFGEDEQYLISDPNGFINLFVDLSASLYVVWCKPTANALVLKVRI